MYGELPALPIPELQPIGIAVHQVGADVTVVHVCGELDLLTAPMLQAEVDKHLKPPPPVLVMDLTGITFFGASGIAVLLDARNRTARAATSLRLVNRTRVVARPLELLHLNLLFRTYPDLAGALRA
jgi:anti-sigma B factor antagonist